MTTLDEGRAAAVEALCELLVPGSSAVGPAVYVDAVLSAMPEPVREHALAAIDALAPAAAGGTEALAEHERTPELALMRALAIEAYYSDFVAPGRDAPGAYADIDFNSPLARRIHKDWSFMGIGRRRLDGGDQMAKAPARPAPGAELKDSFDVVVVGSGAGGGVVAGELAGRGRDVLLLELGPHRTAASFTRWESRAAMELMWPIRFAFAADGDVIAFLAGRCVGGTTTINTKVALRAHERDVAKWHPATGLTSDGSTPFAASDLGPYYERVERLLGVRERNDWPDCLRTIEPAFRELGAPLEAVTAYTDANCSKCGSCIQGCPTNAGKSTMNTYIAEALAHGLLELRADSRVERVLVEDGEAVGVEYVDAGGARHTVRARAVVVACGALNTPQLLLRSGLADPAIGRNLGLHPVRLVYGLFDEAQDAHMVYPITAHSMAHQHDEDGGFVIEATTVQDPIGFATTLSDESGPLWGRPLVEAVRRYRYWNGVLAMVNDENTSAVVVDEDGGERFDVAWNETERRRLDAALAFSREVLERAGARQVCWSGIASTHVQGSCRMGDDPARSVVDRNGESHEVRRLFVGDASLVPRTLSVNPSLTIMALATRLAEHLDADAKGYLERPAGSRAAA